MFISHLWPVILPKHATPPTDFPCQGNKNNSRLNIHSFKYYLKRAQRVKLFKGYCFKLIYDLEVRNFIH